MLTSSRSHSLTSTKSKEKAEKSTGDYQQARSVEVRQETSCMGYCNFGYLGQIYISVNAKIFVTSVQALWVPGTCKTAKLNSWVISVLYFLAERSSAVCLLSEGILWAAATGLKQRVREEELWQVMFCGTPAASDCTQSTYSEWGAGNGAFRLPYITGRKPVYDTNESLNSTGFEGPVPFSNKNWAWRINI